MHHPLWILLWTAVTIGVVHTVIGPDHYVPFVMLAKARGWSRRKTAAVTCACGVGHVLGSVALGSIGIAAGIALARVRGVESFRGTVTAWLLIAFGCVYAAWGLKRAVRNRPHEHAHFHLEGNAHSHTHTHETGHVHVHEDRQKSVTPWVLFLIFVFGPCEPLIPLLMYPAAAGSAASVALVAGVFAIATIGTMLVTVQLLLRGIHAARVPVLERYSHALAGGTIALCGVLVLAGL
jgi:nickel/cobalt transporter (NicO) family protein